MLKFNFKKLKFLRSLKVRIFLIVFIVGLIPSIVTRQAILQNNEERAVSLRTSDVQTQLKILSASFLPLFVKATKALTPLSSLLYLLPQRSPIRKSAALDCCLYFARHGIVQHITFEELQDNRKEIANKNTY